MREFLRYLFVVAAMLMVVVGDVWAECYVLNESQVRIEYKNLDGNEDGTYSSEYDINGPCATMTFSYRLDANSDATYWHKFVIEGKNNAGQWVEIYDSGNIKNAGSKNVSKDISAYANQISKLRIKRTARRGVTAASSGTKDVLVNNLKITRQVSISQDKNTINFGSIVFGNAKPTEDVVITYSNVGTDITVSSNSEHFTVSPTNPTFDKCSGQSTLTITYDPKSTGIHSGEITMTCKDGSTTKGTIKISVSGTAKGKPVHTWTGATEFLVDEMIDLASLWETSNKENTPSCAIEKFVAEDETGVDPILNGTSIKLTRAGKLTVKIIQDASEIYSALSTTQEIIIKKRPSNFRWLLGDPLDCYVDDFCDESVLLSRLSDAPITITSNNTNAVVYQDGKFTAVGAGEAAITVEQGKHYKWEEFTSTYTIRVNKYDMSASLVRGDAVWNELIDNAIIVSHELQDYSVESLNSGIAEYVAGNKIQTYFTEGTAQFRVTRDADRKYKKLDVTLDLNVKRSDEGCLVLDAPDEVSLEYSVLWQERIYEPTSFKGIPDELTFYAYKSNGTAVGDIEVQQYVGNNWIAVKDNSGNDVDIDAATSYRKYGPYELDESATKVRFYNGYGSYWRYFKNVQVTRKTYLRPTATELTLPQTNIGKSSEKTFDLSWSTCSDDIKLVSNNDLFEVGTTQINSTARTGTTNSILVRFKGANEPGTYSAVITIYDQSQKIEIPVSCEVKAKLTTEIVYKGEYRYGESRKCLEGLFFVRDENGDVVADAKIVLASSNEAVLEVCGNAGFQTHCGGQVILTATYAGDELREGASWSEEMFVENCNQVIVWNQNFRDYIAATDGSINESRVLSAYADPTRFVVTYELDAAAQAFARLENGSLVVTGIGTGHIIASAPAGMYQGKMYDATSVMYEIRVSRAGDECETEESLTTNEITLSDVLFWLDNSKEFELDGRPYDRMEFYAHVSNESLNNKMTVTFSTDNGASWGTSSQFDIPKEYDWANPFMCTFIPDGANRVKFTTTSTTNTYFNMVKMVQESYLRAKDMVGNNLAEIVIDDAIVNDLFSRTFVVEYSDVPLIQYSVTDSHDLGLKLEPNPTISNNCGGWGRYTFTLTGESPYPQSGVIEKIRLYTSAGDEVVIPITITATLSEPFYFNVQDGDWNESTNWTHKGSTTHGMVPDKQFPVVVSKALQIGNESTSCKAVAYNVTIEGEGNVKIGSKGGLTLHAGGFAKGVTEDNFVIDNTPQGAGYVRVSPYFINKVPGTMPSIKVNYTTKAYNGVWQYFGAPGSNATLYGEGNTQVYLWSEPHGWMPDDGSALSAFEGYALTQYNGENASYSLIATPICANQTINLTKTSNGMNGDNLFVNSYLAPIDLTKFTDDDFSGNFEKTFYLFNSGSWDDWQNNGGNVNNGFTSGDARGQYFAITPLSVKLLDTNIEQTVIPSMQGVYVIANENGASIKLNYNKHVYKAEAANMHHHMRAPEITDRDFMRVRMQVGSMNSGADRLYVIQYKEGTSGFDNGYDARNILAEGQANIYTSEQDGEMEISVSDKVDGTYIGFAAGGDSEYVLRLASVVGELYLKDLETETVWAVMDGEEYTFYATPNTKNDRRFLLLDHKPEQSGGVSTGVENVHSTKAWIADNVVYVTNAPINTELVVYTMSGAVVTSFVTTTTYATIDLANMPIGVYMLRLNEKAYKFVKK